MASLLLDPEEAALRGLVDAICANCINQGTTSREDIENTVAQYRPRYPSLTAEMIEGGIIAAGCEVRRPGGDYYEDENKEENDASNDGGGGSEYYDGEVCLPVGGLPPPEILPGAAVAAEDGRRKGKPGQKICSVDECSNQAYARGVCRRHNGSRKPHYCKVEGCTKRAQRAGICISHGAKVSPRCKVEGCDKHVQRRGLCTSHGGWRYMKPKPKKICAHEGCANIVRSRGVCVTHGAPRNKRCSAEECESAAVAGGVCRRHGADQQVKTCSREGCADRAKRGGLCANHGPRCKHDGCLNNVTRRNGMCTYHARSALEESQQKCSTEGCSNVVHVGGVCRRHANAVKICSVDGCISQVRQGGVCGKHMEGGRPGSKKRKRETTENDANRGVSSNVAGMAPWHMPEGVHRALKGGLSDGE